MTNIRLVDTHMSKHTNLLTKLNVFIIHSYWCLLISVFIILSTHVCKLCVPCMHRWGTIEYKFGVMSDDASEVWLSSDHQPAKLKMIHVLCL